MPIYNLTIVKKEIIADSVITLSFQKPEGFQFVPGQYGGFTLINPPEKDAGGITRRFSLLSSPNDAQLQIVTRIQQSAYKRVLNQLEIGSDIKFAGPTGKFILHEDLKTPAVLIAGGMGIAPFYSMIKDAVQHQSPRHISLFYGNQQPSTTAFLDELSEFSKTNKEFHFIPTFAAPESNWQGETGFINQSMIKKYIHDIHAPYYYICGAPAMVTAMQEMLAEMGIDEDRLMVEDFPGY